MLRTPDRFHEDVYSCAAGILDLDGLQDGFVLPLFREYGLNEDRYLMQSVNKGVIEQFIPAEVEPELDAIHDIAGPNSVRPGDAEVFGFSSNRFGAMCGNYHLIRDFVLDISEDYREENPFTFYEIMDFAKDRDGVRQAAALIKAKFGEFVSQSRLEKDYPDVPGGARRVLSGKSESSRYSEPLIQSIQNSAKLETIRELPLDQVLMGDCASLMKMLPSASIDCIFADPPYNLQRSGELRKSDNSLVDAGDEGWDRFGDLSAYDAFTREWLSECRRLLKTDGTLWVIGAYHNIFRIGTIMQDLGFWILNDVIWRKTNPMPNFRGRRFTNAHETLIWAARGRDSRYKFNYQAMKTLNDDLQMRSDWFLPLCTGPERLRNQHGLKLHPTQKPESLLHRVLLASTAPGDIVLDPFLGTGTTAAVAKRLRRQYIGIEKHPSYAEAAITRIRNVQCAPTDAVGANLFRHSLPRVSFGSLVESSVISPGSYLYDRSQSVRAIVEADGSIAVEIPGSELQIVRGSIHKVGAVIQKTPSCNGWTFWHFQRGDDLVTLDHMRDKFLDAEAANSADT
jgi:modification methylase